jgi:hypothetical protein
VLDFLQHPSSNVLAEAGVEHSAESPENTPVSSTGGAKSGALDPDLAALAELWPLILPRTKAYIVEVARGATI